MEKQNTLFHKIRHVSNITTMVISILLFVCVLILLINLHFTDNKLEIYERQQDEMASSLETSRKTIESLQMSTIRLESGISLENKRRFALTNGADIIRKVRPQLSYQRAITYAEFMYNESKKYPSVPYTLLLAIGTVESSFNKDTVSPKGACGLMQFMELTAMDISESLRIDYSRSRLFDPQYSIMLAAKYIDRRMSIFNNIEHTIAAYNGGDGGGYTYKNYKNGLVEKDSVNKETFDFVQKVLQYKTQYDKILGM